LIGLHLSAYAQDAASGKQAFRMRRLPRREREPTA